MLTQQQTEHLARSIVLAQGNNFIKELLRAHEIRIGTTKADFEENLIQAIRDGALTHADIETWLRENEGWGNQTIYPYRLTRAAATNAIWNSEQDLQTELRNAGLNVEALWGADTSLEFPDVPTLTGINFEPGVGLQFVWHRGTEIWKRDTSEDYEKQIRGDLYRFKASRHLARRSLIRCEIRPQERLAVIFVQLPGEEDHTGVLQTVVNATASVVDLRNARRYPVSDSIMGLDDLALQQNAAAHDVQCRSVGLTAGAASITFSSIAGGTYQNVPAVRQVRRAVVANRFAGQHGEFTLTLDNGDGHTLDVLVQLQGEKYRAHVRSQLTRDQVWNAIGHICQF